MATIAARSLRVSGVQAQGPNGFNPKLLPAHMQKTLSTIVQSCLRKSGMNFNSDVNSAQVTLSNGSISLRLGKKNLGCNLTERNIKDLKRITAYQKRLLSRRVIRGAEHISSLSQKVWRDGSNEVGDTYNPVLATTGLLLDGSSIARSVLSIRDGYGPNSAAVSGIKSLVMLPLTLLSSGYMVRNGLDEADRLRSMGDNEGRKEELRRVGEGALLFSGATLWGLSGLLDHMDKVAPALQLSGFAAAAFGGASLLGTGISITNIYRTHRFMGRIKDYIENTALNDEERTIGALRFLIDQFEISHEELQEARGKVLKLPTNERVEALQQRISEIVLRKKNRLKRRVGNKAMELIFSKGREILDQIDSDERVKGLKAAQALIKTVLNECEKRQFSYLIMLIATLLSFSALIASMYVGSLTLPFILSGVSSGMYLILGIYGVILYNIHKSREANFDLRAQNISFLDHLIPF